MAHAMRYAAQVTSVIPFEQPGIRGFLHQPEPGRGNSDGMVLTHGAGGNCRAPLLIAAADAFSGHGWCVLRCDLPFRQRRPSGPPSPATAAADRSASDRYIAAFLAERVGASFSGRIHGVPRAGLFVNLAETGAGVTRVKAGDLVCPAFAQLWVSGVLREDYRPGMLGGPLDGEAGGGARVGPGLQGGDHGRAASGQHPRQGRPGEAAGAGDGPLVVPSRKRIR